MKAITTWYKKQPNGDYKYNHFTYGHTSTNKKDWLHKNCQLNIDRTISRIEE